MKNQHRGPSTPVEVFELAVNLDDVTAELLGDVQQTLLEAGALDVWTTPIGMKKQRPGVMLSLLCEPSKRDELAKGVIELTGSFGVRFRSWGRLILDRHHITVTTRFGDVRIKVGSMGENVLTARPEFEDVSALARRSSVPLREVLAAAQAAADQWQQGQGGAT